MTERIRCRTFDKCRTFGGALRHFAIVSHGSVLHAMRVYEFPVVSREGKAVGQRQRTPDRDKRIRPRVVHRYAWAWNGVFDDVRAAVGA